MFVDLNIDAINEHDGVIDNDAAQGDDAQQGHKAEIRACNQQAECDPDHTQGNGQQNDQRTA